MTTLIAGAKAPVFKGVDQNGNPISLADFKGKKVVLYFYPKDDTPTCTVQACNLRDNQHLLTDEGIEVIGVSIDPVKKHKKFETKYGLTFPLVADEDHKIAEQYGVWGEKKFMGRVFDGTHRTTFLIDEKGKIKHIIQKPDSKNHTRQVLDAWNESGNKTQ
ncbi:thioredoxin-dependent thiol peroxidase [Segetibacter sp. 3557_3]|uniref:thioredoxin-dependent thiol peroxidase n=1 Tax=Segetibacter sp. 3557_3 TaxID=2547429 RepID=UPI001058D03C|nr:thioredoxin-dependent thiol peroxidase [Segetibacter sp. 3557_3]TDH24096.1 thioredoxin-dependent thiol peroxidase [Segetibacter sp. 3557_3]